VRNIVSLFRGLQAIERPDLLIGRSFQAALVVALFAAIRGIPYIYDMRGDWVATVVRNRRPPVQKILRLIDTQIVDRASGVITLTELQKTALTAKDHSRVGRVVCVPTLVDDERYALKRRKHSRKELPASLLPLAPRLERSLVIGYVGSLNSDYLVRESLLLVSILLRQNDGAFFVGLSLQDEILKAAAEEAAIPKSRTAIHSARTDEVEGWLTYIDWGLLLMRSGPDKAGSMPTKLGEFLAAGVRPICHGCNSEVNDWVSRTGSGLLVPDVSESGLRSVAEEIVDASTSHQDLVAASVVSASHFSLSVGVEKYLLLCERILTAASNLKGGAKDS
jgi:hypothetical protein